MSGTDALSSLLASTGPVLLDFDGPVTPLMPRPRNFAVADAVRAVLSAAVDHELPPAISETTDHLVILRYAHAEYPGDAARAVECAVNVEEVAAALDAQPTAGSVELLQAFRHAGRPVVVVSNNGRDAITSYLERHGLAAFVLAVIGRTPGQPGLMKPHPHALQRALAVLDSPADQCVMVGDSVSDVEASHAAGVRIIGYAKTHERGRTLAAAGADAMADDMLALAVAVTAAAGGQPWAR